MTGNQIEILRMAIMKNGVREQLGMVSEEIGEYLQAVNKVARLRGIHRDVISRPIDMVGDNDKLIKYSLAYYGLCSEVADLKIMVQQLELMLEQEAIDLAVDRKIKRLEKRLSLKNK